MCCARAAFICVCVGGWVIFSLLSKKEEKKEKKVYPPITPNRSLFILLLAVFMCVAYCTLRIPRAGISRALFNVDTFRGI